MSWSVNAVIPAGADVTEAAKALEVAALEAQLVLGEWSAETRHQVQAAVNSAAVLAASGALGKLEILAVLGGHANPEHDSAHGLAPDSVGISLTQHATVAA